MTMTDWRTLEAGPELDANVAERVFGWTGCQVQHGRFAGYPPNSGQFTFGRPYSTDIAAAWLVVERMRDRGYWVRIEDYTDGWRVTFSVPSKDEPDDWLNDVMLSEAGTMPAAVCDAALEVLEAHERPHGAAHD